MTQEMKNKYNHKITLTEQDLVYKGNRAAIVVDLKTDGKRTVGESFISPTGTMFIELNPSITECVFETRDFVRCLKIIQQFLKQASIQGMTFSNQEERRDLRLIQMSSGTWYDQEQNDIYVMIGIDCDDKWIFEVSLEERSTISELRFHLSIVESRVEIAEMVRALEKSDDTVIRISK